MQVISVIFVTLVLFCLGQCRKPDYCDKKLCPANSVHIGCKNKGLLGKACARDAKIIPLSKTQVLDLHNTLRNQIAGGKVTRFKPAGRMATMVWDPELADLAELNVKQCRMAHDRCRSTKKFPYAGQNLAYSGWSGRRRELQEVTLEQIRNWYAENTKASMKYINSYSQPTNGAVIGHFTQLVQEKATHVGCAVLRQTSKGFTEQYLACNYAFTNMLSEPVYTTAKKGGANCKTGHHQSYEYLCSTEEKYDLS